MIDPFHKDIQWGKSGSKVYLGNASFSEAACEPLAINRRNNGLTLRRNVITKTRAAIATIQPRIVNHVQGLKKIKVPCVISCGDHFIEEIVGQIVIDLSAGFSAIYHHLHVKCCSFLLRKFFI